MKTLFYIPDGAAVTITYTSDKGHKTIMTCVTTQGVWCPMNENANEMGACLSLKNIVVNVEENLEK